MIVKWTVGTPLNIAGAPADNPLVDTPLLKQYRAGGHDGEILLPASTIKGKLRGETQRVARTFGVGGILCHGRTPETMCPAYWWNKTSMPPDHLCLLCQLFGSPWQPATLAFSDVTPQQVRSSDARVRPGVGLSRVRGTAQEDMLFFVETTPALEEGVIFANCHIEGAVPDERSAALLWMAVQYTAAFGNGRSRGRGWLKNQEKEVEMTLDGVAWDKAKVTEVWRNWLGLSAEGGEQSD